MVGMPTIENCCFTDNTEKMVKKLAARSARDELLVKREAYKLSS